VGERRPAPSVFLVVGLGNPGPRYAGTRHNAGALAVERLAARLGVTFRRSLRFGARIARPPGAVLALPDSFMNESGRAVARLARYHRRLDPLVVHDDLDLPLGTLRFRTGGGSGGHNGVRSVIERLGSSAFPRLRIGIGRPERKDDVTPWVLSAPQGAERDRFQTCVERAAEALQAVLTDGLPAAMTRYSGPLPGGPAGAPRPA
jgi:PTH1 family peptidyl-tRNA hydrolase